MDVLEPVVHFAGVASAWTMRQVQEAVPLPFALLGMFPEPEDIIVRKRIEPAAPAASDTMAASVGEAAAAAEAEYELLPDPRGEEADEFAAEFIALELKGPEEPLPTARSVKEMAQALVEAAHAPGDEAPPVPPRKAKGLKKNKPPRAAHSRAAVAPESSA